MILLDAFLDKWRRCVNSRYRVMLITPARQDRFPEELIKEVTEVIGAERTDFATRYQGELESFFTRWKIQEEIREGCSAKPLLVSSLEPFYSKWPEEERYAFLRYMLRMEVTHGVVLLLYCREDLTDLKGIAENSRGTIWTP
ncbi:MAG: hypothetical protein P4L55_12465 [Syntrophobacteraceae bacterium]|nr:hypothetical protein [Syntrophobacteraceae bacterium]